MTMRRALVVILMAGTAMASVPLDAQQRDLAAREPATTPKPAMVPLEVELVLSRYQGDRKVSSLPYTLTVNANGGTTTMNMGSRVPVPSTTFAPQANGQPPTALQSYNYQDIGTSIELAASSVTEGGFQLQVSVDDSSVAATDSGRSGQAAPVPAIPNLPVFRSFRGRNTLLLKDGQSRQYIAATDRVSGEVLKVDVTLKVLK